MDFDAYEYLWPPRPERSIPTNLLAMYQKRGWIAQAKMNGTCNVLAVSPTKEIVAMNRHKETHKLWTPTAASSAAFKALPGKGWYVFVTELLHSKVQGLRDINYIHDVLVANGDYLVGKTMVERQDILSKLFLTDKNEEENTHHVINKNTWLVKNRLANFGAFYESLDKPEHEGLVLKNPNAPLAYCFKQSSNADWSVKCRKQHKNYSF